MAQPLPSHSQSPDFVSVYPTPFKITFLTTGHKGGLCVYIVLLTLNSVTVPDFLLAGLKPQILYLVLAQDLAQEFVSVHYGRGSNHPIWRESGEKKKIGTFSEVSKKKSFRRVANFRRFSIFLWDNCLGECFFG